MEIQTSAKFTLLAFLVLLPSYLILSSTLCLAQVDDTPSDLTNQNAVDSSGLSGQTVMVLTDAEVWEERMRRIWGSTINAFMDGDCGEKTPCPSTIEENGGTSTTGSITVHNSQVRGSIVNQSRDDQSANQGIGRGARATRGSITLRRSTIQGRITNRSQVEQSANQAIGKGTTATMGSITVQDSNFRGRMSNRSEVEQSANQAIGKEATATMGSIAID